MYHVMCQFRVLHGWLDFFFKQYTSHTFPFPALWRGATVWTSLIGILEIWDALNFQIRDAPSVKSMKVFQNPKKVKPKHFWSQAFQIRYWTLLKEVKMYVRQTPLLWSHLSYFVLLGISWLHSLNHWKNDGCLMRFLHDSIKQCVKMWGAD
jgi:hypothetical protein